MAGYRETCRRALLGLMRPVVRFALRNSFRLRDAVECLKFCFVEAAVEELKRLGEPVTASKISAMTGIQRPEVRRLTEGDPELQKDSDVITRITGLWQTSPAFKDKSGKPRVLDFTGRSGEFAKLVERVSTDLNPYTVAFEMERAGIAEQTEDGVKLIKAGFEAQKALDQALPLLVQDTNDLYSAVSENIFDDQPCPNLHAKTEFDNIPASKMLEVRNWFLEKGAKLHKEARAYLASLDRDVNPKLKKAHAKEDKLRAVIGTYGFTE